jgi:hypothetical protein
MGVVSVVDCFNHITPSVFSLRAWWMSINMSPLRGFGPVRFELQELCHPFGFLIVGFADGYSYFITVGVFVVGVVDSYNRIAPSGFRLKAC